MSTENIVDICSEDNMESGVVKAVFDAKDFAFLEPREGEEKGLFLHFDNFRLPGFYSDRKLLCVSLEECPRAMVGDEIVFFQIVGQMGPRCGLWTFKSIWDGDMIQYKAVQTITKKTFFHSSRTSVEEREVWTGTDLFELFILNRHYMLPKSRPNVEITAQLKAFTGEEWVDVTGEKIPKAVLQELIENSKMVNDVT